MLNQAFEATKLDQDSAKSIGDMPNRLTRCTTTIWNFPTASSLLITQFTIFSTNTLLQNIDDWLICNQALSAETDSQMWQSLLNDAILKYL